MSDELTGHTTDPAAVVADVVARIRVAVAGGVGGGLVGGGDGGDGRAPGSGGDGLGPDGDGADGRGRVVVLVDGRSGTGKTTLGNALAVALRAQVVHLDDVYPGWDGLRAAADAVVTDVLGAPSGYRSWDWQADRPAAWRTVDPDAPLVIEGCGALSRASAPLATVRLWLEADDAVRWDRAIGRDGATFEREWARWADQEDAFIRTEQPAALADVVLRT
ncbi:ATP-binding protein [Curtobacterium sp. MCPF17_046]|uniref:ATP-binding protein n=1 Tax=Curtobacterium sp. MCPF17_046 TaxID=2175663 RepID=UPI0021ACEDB7|nr:ATP-binding protein [Curtobacterium sp. MCPF17_046]